MSASLRNLKTSEIELRQILPPLECEWLVGSLRARPGIAGARWSNNTDRLLVEYDADRLGSAEIVDYLQSCGIPVAALRAGYT